MTGAAWFGAALALLVAFLIGRFNGTQAARLARMDRAAAEERAELWRVQAIKGAEAIGRLDQEIRAARLCRDQAEAERDELRGQLAHAETQRDELRAKMIGTLAPHLHRTLSTTQCPCAVCKAERIKKLKAQLAQAQAEAAEPDNDDAPVINPNAKNNGADIDGAEVTS